MACATCYEARQIILSAGLTVCSTLISQFLAISSYNRKIFSGATSLLVVLGRKICPFLHCDPHFHESN